jgi:[ribosomal protein S5]-alanine N-acetyltransferase
MELSIPVLEPAQLRLRPFSLADGPDVERLAGAFEVADTTLNMPHPYPEGAAAQWIAGHPEQAQRGDGLTWAITDRASGTLYGAIGLTIRAAHQHAELGYWMGHPYWGRGHTSAAAAAVLAHAFTALNLNRIFAQHFARNPASGRVMQKIGMRYEGCRRQHFLKGERFEDVLGYAILREEWAAR